MTLSPPQLALVEALRRGGSLTWSRRCGWRVYAETTGQIVADDYGRATTVGRWEVVAEPAEATVEALVARGVIVAGRWTGWELAGEWKRAEQPVGV